MATKGLINAVVLGAGLVAGGLAAVMIFRHFNAYPLRLAGMRGEVAYAPSLSSSDVPSEFTNNTIPMQTTPMLMESDDYVARRNKGARWYS